jgi:hypothetical protein
MNCGTQDGTIVAAHANSSRFGKGMSHKAADWAIAFLCYRCHSELDHGNKMNREEKLSMWLEASIKTWGWLVETGKVKVA